jgi:translation initiation factor 2 beta subunit (eIF-2beta)/eIF-5
MYICLWLLNKKNNFVILMFILITLLIKYKNSRINKSKSNIFILQYIFIQSLYKKEVKKFICLFL